MLREIARLSPAHLIGGGFSEAAMTMTAAPPQRLLAERAEGRCGEGVLSPTWCRYWKGFKRGTAVGLVLGEEGCWAVTRIW